jgi:hypothetical protein
MTSRIMSHMISRVWRADMALAREAFAQGDPMLGHLNLRRAATARRWIREDLQSYQRQYGRSLLAPPLRSLAAPPSPGGIVVRPNKKPARRRR